MTICKSITPSETQDKPGTLREAIAEGLESGVSERSLDAIWADGERRARKADA